MGRALRIDEGIYEGYNVPFYYDPLLCKVMTWGKTRDDAISRMQRVLHEMHIEGIQTSLPFHRLAMENKKFNSGEYTTDFIEKEQMVKKVRELAKKAHHEDEK